MDSEQNSIIQAIKQFEKNKDLEQFETIINQKMKIFTQDFSLEEVERLEEQAEEDKIFIAPISNHDGRFQYYGFYDKTEALPKDVLLKIKAETKKLKVAKSNKNTTTMLLIKH